MSRASECVNGVKILRPERAIAETDRLSLEEFLPNPSPKLLHSTLLFAAVAIARLV
jgi:hypothetical protein